MSTQSTTKYITDLSHIREIRACVSPWLLSKDFVHINCEQRALIPAISLYLPMAKYIAQTPTVSNQIAWSDWSVARSPWSVKRICFLPGFLVQQQAQRFCFAFPSFRCKSFQQKSIFLFNEWYGGISADTISEIYASVLQKQLSFVCLVCEA